VSARARTLVVAIARAVADVLLAPRRLWLILSGKKGRTPDGNLVLASK
jgi:hypothetical protein